MKTTNRHKLTLLFGIILVMLTFGMTLKAQLPSPPVPPRLVNDYTGTLTASQIEALERKLVAYDDSTSTQILVMLVESPGGKPVAAGAVPFSVSMRLSASVGGTCVASRRASSASTAAHSAW